MVLAPVVAERGAEGTGVDPLMEDRPVRAVLVCKVLTADRDVNSALLALLDWGSCCCWGERLGEVTEAPGDDDDALALGEDAPSSFSLVLLETLPPHALTNRSPLKAVLLTPLSQTVRPWDASVGHQRSLSMSPVGAGVEKSSDRESNALVCKIGGGLGMNILGGGSCRCPAPPLP